MGFYISLRNPFHFHSLYTMFWCFPFFLFYKLAKKGETNMHNTIALCIFLSLCVCSHSLKNVKGYIHIVAICKTYIPSFWCWFYKQKTDNKLSAAPRSATTELNVNALAKYSLSLLNPCSSQYHNEEARLKPAYRRELRMWQKVIEFLKNRNWWTFVLFKSKKEAML